MIDLYPVKFNDFSTIDEISPKEGFEFRKKNIFLIRNFEDIVGAGCISIQFFIQIQVMRQIQNWKVTERPQRAADVKSGYVGIGVFNKSKIHIAVGTDLIQRRNSAAGFQKRKTFVLQICDHRVPENGIFHGDENDRI
jgi:hypothetical protein